MNELIEMLIIGLVGGGTIGFVLGAYVWEGYIRKQLERYGWFYTPEELEQMAKTKRESEK